MAKNKAKPIDLSTEEKIKKAAKSVFHRKGYAATRTRDIAEEAQINLALLNYYYRSKEKLFNLVMVETVSGFLGNMLIVFNDEDTTLEKKISLMVEKYIDLFIAEPEIPLFLLSEIQRGPIPFPEKTKIQDIILQSVFVRQYREGAKKQKIKARNPLHFLMNLTSLIIFPFVSRPMIARAGKLSQKEFVQLMKDRKRLVPIWMKAILSAG